MSVPVNQRSEGKLEVCLKAHDLCCYTETGKVLMFIRPENVKREKKKLRRLVIRSRKGFLPKEKVDESYAAWRNHASKGNSFKPLQRMDAYYKILWRYKDGTAYKKQDGLN